MTEIMIVDDHHLIRYSIVMTLRDVDGLEVVAEAESGEDALNQLQYCRPDVILLDIEMPGMGGVETVRKVRRYYPEVKIIMLSAHATMRQATSILQMGVTGYVTKGSRFQEVVEAIRCAMNGERYIDNTIVNMITIHTISGYPSSPIDLLSPREQEIAMMVTRGMRIGDIAEKLNLSSKTISTYRSRIFGKLGLSGDVELAMAMLQYTHIYDNTVVYPDRRSASLKRSRVTPKLTPKPIPGGVGKI